jgi:hypothetical protein
MKKLLVFTLLIFSVSLVFAEKVAMPAFTIPTARSSGMGGTHVAYTDNVFALLVNPAAIMRVEQKSFFAQSFSMFNPESTFGILGSIIDMAGGDTSNMGKAADTLSKQKGKIALGLDIREFPFSVSWVADGFGFGLWNRIFVNPNIQGTHVSVNVYADVILPGAFAFKILDTDNHAVDAGITLKPFVRGIATERINIMDMMDGDVDILDTMSVPLVIGAGFDIGFLYRWDLGLSAGLTFDDIATYGGAVTDFIQDNNSNTYYVPFSMNLGVAYDFKLGKFWENLPGFFANTEIAFAFDWHNVTNVFQQKDYTKRNASLDIAMGLQFKVLDMIMVRFGMNEMLPAFGFGFDFGPIELDLAYYGRELGLEPGQLSAAAVEFTFAIRPDAKKREWPWTRGSLVGLIQNMVNSGESE